MNEGLQQIWSLNPWEALAVFVAGAAIGLFQFAGLWFTVRKMASSSFPGLWAVGSSLFRVGVSLALFAFATQLRFDRLLVCLAGWVLMRSALIRRWGPRDGLVAAERKAPG